MKSSEYMTMMKTRSLLLKEIDVSAVAVNSIKGRVEYVEMSDGEYNKAMTKSRYLEEHIADLHHQIRMIEAEVEAKTHAAIEYEERPDDHPDLFEEGDDDEG